MSLLEPVAHDLDRLDALFTVQRDRRGEEAETQALRLACRLAQCQLVERLEIAPDASIRLLVHDAFQVVRIDEDVGAGELGELAQFDGRERRLGRAAAPEHDDVRDARARDRLDRRLRRVGRSQLFGSQREHPRDVERDVPVADHDRALDVEVERKLLVVGMAVVPGDELEGRPRAGEVLGRDPEAPVGLRADGVDDGVVEIREVAVVQVAPDLHVADEAEPRLVRDALERPRDRLQLRMIGRHAEPHEPPGRRQPLEHVHLDRRVGVEQRAGGVEAGRA